MYLYVLFVDVHLYFIYIYIYIYMYIYRQAFQGVVRPCRGRGTSRAKSEPDCSGGSWVLPGRCRRKSQIGPPTAAPRKYPPSTGTVRL